MEKFVRKVLIGNSYWQLLIIEMKTKGDFFKKAELPIDFVGKVCYYLVNLLN